MIGNIKLQSSPPPRTEIVNGELHSVLLKIGRLVLLHLRQIGGHIVHVDVVAENATVRLERFTPLHSRHLIVHPLNGGVPRWGGNCRDKKLATLVSVHVSN